MEFISITNVLTKNVVKYVDTIQVEQQGNRVEHRHSHCDNSDSLVAIHINDKTVKDYYTKQVN